MRSVTGSDPKPENDAAGKLMVGVGAWFSERRARRTNAEEGTQRRGDGVGARAAKAGKPVRELCREIGISAQAFYTWKRKYAGLGSNEFRHLRELNGRRLRSLLTGSPDRLHLLRWDDAYLL